MSRPPQPDLHGTVQTRAHDARPRRLCQRLGRPADDSAGCAAAACRPLRSAISSSGSAWRKPTAWSTPTCSTFDPRGAEQDGAAADGVLRQLKVVIENYPEGQSEELDAVNHPDNLDAAPARSSSGAPTSSATTSWKSRPKFFGSRRAWMRGCATPFHHLPRGSEERTGEIIELRCTYDPDDARRQCAGRPQGQGRSIGFRRTFQAGGSPYL